MQLVPFVGNKAKYPLPNRGYDTVVDLFAGSLGGTLKLVTGTPGCRYLVAERSPYQRALIECLLDGPAAFNRVRRDTHALVDEFLNQENFQAATRWVVSEYDKQPAAPALSVFRRFFYSGILRTNTSGGLNVKISVERIIRKNLPGEQVYKTPEFQNGMHRGVEVWYSKVKPVIDLWFSEPRNLRVFPDYRDLLDPLICGDRRLFYVDPPYYGNLCPAYEFHQPRSPETWKMTEDPVMRGLELGADLVICNYLSPELQELVQIIQAHGYTVSALSQGKELNCSGRVKTSSNKEVVLFAEKL